MEVRGVGGREVDRERGENETRQPNRDSQREPEK